MLYYALVFLIVGLIAGALGIYGVAAIASQIAWVLFLIGIVLLLVHLVTGRLGSASLEFVGQFGPRVDGSIRHVPINRPLTIRTFT